MLVSIGRKASAGRAAPQAAGGAATGRLTPRETEVLRHIALGKTNREISDRLDSAIVTIRSVLDTGEDG